MDANRAVASPTVSAPAPTSRARRRKATHDKRRDINTASTKTRRKAAASLPPGMKPKYVTTAQTRGLLGIRDTKLWNLIKNRTLETVKLDGRRMVVFESIERFDAALRQKEIDRPRSGRADKAIARSKEARRERREAAAAATA
jgi:hypothetical protein